MTPARICGHDIMLYPTTAEAAAAAADAQPAGTMICLYVMGPLKGDTARWHLEDAAAAAPRHNISIRSATDCEVYAGLIRADTPT